MFAGGIAFAYYRTDSTPLQNDWYTRPDFKQFPAMINPEDTEYDPVVMNQMLGHSYGNYKATRVNEETKDRYGRNQPTVKKGFFYRLIWPDDADWTPRTSSYIGRPGLQNYDWKNGEFPTINHNYGDNKHA